MEEVPCSIVRDTPKDGCKSMELADLAKAAIGEKTGNLNMFSSVKTHSVGNPFRVIVAEKKL